MIRRMENSDLDAVIDIWRQGNLSAHCFISSAYWESYLDYMRDVLPKSDVWVYCINERIVAFIGLINDYIAGMFVAEDYRSQGVGHELIEHLKSHCKTLSLCVYEKNHRAIEFYVREGFKQIDCRIDKPTCETEILMQYVESNSI